MSEISTHQNDKAQMLHVLFHAVLQRNDAVNQIKAAKTAIENAGPYDIIDLVDKLMSENIPLAELKTGVNKFLNVLGNTIRKLPEARAGEGSFIWLLQQNNKQLSEKLGRFKTLVKALNSTPNLNGLWQQAAEEINEIAAFEAYYTIKENVLFPVIEKHWTNHRCTQLMWSFHDDIRNALQQVATITASPKPDLQQFNKSVGDLYFTMLAIRLRDEKLLFPQILASIPGDALDRLLQDCHDPELPFIKAPTSPLNTSEDISGSFESIDLSTGSLSAAQLLLLFNHLPVDITYVDEFDKVRFFSSPPHRIFPRSRAIIGRDVHQCHPPESVDIVHRIIEGFRSGRKSEASFWIKMKQKVILIRYFALRDAGGTYKGVIEVSQEISEIQQLKGEQRLLDWED